MDIERINHRQNDPAINGHVAARRAERAANEAQIKPEAGRFPSDKLEISEGARELARARQAVDAAPDVRTQKVADIKKRIEDGTYTVSPHLLAQKILDGSDGSV